MSQAPASQPSARKPLWHHLYFWVLVGISTGILIGVLAPSVGASMKWMADLFIKLVKLVIAPTIFATVAAGIASMGDLARAGGLALRAVIYYNLTTVFAIGIGLVVVNVLQPGAGLDLDVASFDASAAEATLRSAGAVAGTSMTDFLLDLVPDTFVGAFVGTQLMQVLVLAVLTGCSIAIMGGERARAAEQALDLVSGVLFGIIRIVMWTAPLGAMGGMAFTIGEYGAQILGSLGLFMLTFYLSCILYLFLILGPVCYWSGFSIVRYLRYIKDELLIVLGTSSSETVLPRMLAKMEAAGVPRVVAGLMIPTGYSFNLDGTAIYMVMGAIFIAQAFGIDVPLMTQIGLLLFMTISSNGAAGVSGAGLVTLAASLAAFDSVIPLAGIALIVGIDRFMSEARALTNLAGNGIGTLMMAHWMGQLDHAQLERAFKDPDSINVDALAKH